jgi:hypothetical protein
MNSEKRTKALVKRIVEISFISPPQVFVGYTQLIDVSATRKLTKSERMLELNPGRVFEKREPALLVDSLFDHYRQ